MELPEDIINIIYTFNADHREQMKPVLKEIEKTYFIWTYKKCVSELSKINSDDNTYFIEIIQEIIEMKDHEIKRHLDFWGNCMCCRRHIVDKPRISENEYNYYYDQFSEYIRVEDFNGPTFYEYKAFYEDCNCICRHFSRWIVRAYTNNYLI